MQMYIYLIKYLWALQYDPYFGPVTIKDMQTPVPLPLIFDQPFMDDGECVI